jgi:hypothetical protein
MKIGLNKEVTRGDISRLSVISHLLQAQIYNTLFLPAAHALFSGQ